MFPESHSDWGRGEVCLALLAVESGASMVGWKATQDGVATQPHVEPDLLCFTFPFSREVSGKLRDQCGPQGNGTRAGNVVTSWSGLSPRTLSKSLGLLRL